MGERYFRESETIFRWSERFFRESEIIFRTSEHNFRESEFIFRKSELLFRESEIIFRLVFICIRKSDMLVNVCFMQFSTSGSFFVEKKFYFSRRFFENYLADLKFLYSFAVRNTFNVYFIFSSINLLTT